MDYEYLGHCEYEMPMGTIETHPMDCREFAIVRVWWKGKGIDNMLLCEEHFEKVKKDETK